MGSIEQQTVEHHDILILGAGLTGINTAHVIRDKLPHRKFAILEKRPVVGGTWSFFKYPGFRSDSFLTVFGFPWHPWPHKHRMANARDIMAYIDDALDSSGLRKYIRLSHEVVSCEWRSQEQKWFVEVDADGVRKTMVANFVAGCTGYYSYEKAFETVIPGLQDFGGKVVHPQWWPEELDYAGKNIVIVGSGATAVTLLPALAEKAGSVTMLQRSPSYVISRSTVSYLTLFLRLFLPLTLVAQVNRLLDTLSEVIATQFLLHCPDLGRAVLTKEMKQSLPDDIEVNVHFNPSYDPFKQRLCLCPDGDFFKALHRDGCSVVTDTIQTVTNNGIQLSSGRKLDADIIITATGLYFQLFGGVEPVVDGKTINMGDHYTWRGCMLDGVPNAAFVMGYVTQSWTPGADAMAATVARLLKHMEAKGASSVTPTIERRPGMTSKIAVSASSNYLVKAADRFPKSTGEGPWYGRTNLVVDLWALWFGSMDVGMVYTRSQDLKNKNV
ncbi:hypothetical protein N3K66_005538 [Trichothecium roseum]|uniref:Uncharacterized protein n=1 Tax=Trichothecium roseum TaxID=47278 RepID=A0ACC0UY44_9HYPO|nr:hypothetical protein N3K66_005538 [Trichothecium roseum]